MSGPKRRDLAERFWEKVARKGPNDCWLWTASLHPFGYGQIGMGSHMKPGRAHRVSWLLAHGPIPQGQSVLHACDVPACVNPAHLFLGSQQDNLRDMREKGRSRSGAHRGHGAGESNVMAKLTADRVREIRNAVASGERQSEIAARFNMSRAAVCMLVNRKTWAHVA